MRKSELREELARVCTKHGHPLPNDYASLTVAGLKERIACLDTALPSDVEEPEAVPSSAKARNAQQFAIRYAEMVRRARADRRDKEAHDAIVAAPKFLAKAFGHHVIAQGERLWLINDKKQRVPLEETNLSW